MIFAYIFSIMPGIPRYAIIDDNAVFHVTWQCHNKDFFLQSEGMKTLYVKLLLKYKKKYKIKIYGACLMDNHPHLTGFCESKELLSAFFRVVNSCFAIQFNKINNRRGQVVMDRFKSPQIQSEADLFMVMTYIDLNSKRAHIVLHPRDYKWSTYAYYAEGRRNELIDQLVDEPDCYMALGSTQEERQNAYKALVEEILRYDWKEKKPYSSVYFIGDPQWVKERHIELKRQQKIKRDIARIKAKYRFDEPLIKETG